MEPEHKHDGDLSRWHNPSLKRESAGWEAVVALVGAVAAVVVLILYARTLAPTILHYDRPELIDSAMLQMQVCVLGITHPTGYPTYLMLSHLFTYLPFGDLAYRVNLASAVYGALAVGVVYWAGYLVSRRVAAAAVGALALGFGGTLWSQAVITEVYTLNALVVALTLAVLLLWRARRKDGHLLLAAFLCGLALTTHMTSGLLLPASLLFVALVEWRKLLDLRLVSKGAGSFLLGLAPYLYLPVRSWMDPPFEANNPSNFERFWYVVSGGNLRGGFLAFGPTELPGRLAFYWDHLLGNFNWGLLVAGLVGFAAMLLWDRAAAALTGFLYFGWLFYAVENDIPDIEIYFIPTYVVVSLWISGGLGVLLEGVQALLSGFARVTSLAVVGALSAATVVLVLPGLGETYANNDMSGDYRGREVVEAAADNAAPNSTILHHRSELWYLVLAERRRRDLTLVDPFRHNKEVLYADIVWPDDLDLPATDRRYGTDDLSGVTTANKAAKGGPVYIIQQDDIDYGKFYDAGWNTVQVKGPLWELVPPGGEPHKRE
ncbi:MAG: DUF2723 domain-containing protein [Actinomycetota bacterium]|nr:DUF2723 domain-containing protein [Actinomycetota bacterium]